MRHLKLLSTFVVAITLQNAAWAEIYETTDAQGNPVFSDSPTGPNAEAINLQKTNIIDAPEAEPQEVSAPQSVEEQQAPEQENRTVIIHDSNNDEDDVEDAYLRREQAFNRMDPEAPREIGDSDAQMPRQVGDSNSQMPREVGDFDAQMPDEVGDNAVPIVDEAGAPAIEHRAVHHNR